MASAWRVNHDDRNRTQPDLPWNFDSRRCRNSGIGGRARARRVVATGHNGLTALRCAALRAYSQAIAGSSLECSAQARPGDTRAAADHRQNAGIVHAHLAGGFPRLHGQSAMREGTTVQSTKAEALGARRDLASLSTRTARASCARGAAQGKAVVNQNLSSAACSSE